MSEVRWSGSGCRSRRGCRWPARRGQPATTEGPLLLANDGSRLDRHDAARIVHRLAKRAGIAKRMSLHSLRASGPSGVTGRAGRICRNDAREKHERRSRALNKAQQWIAQTPRHSSQVGAESWGPLVLVAKTMRVRAI